MIELGIGLSGREGEFFEVLMFSRFAISGILSTIVDAENQIFGYNKTIIGARNPAYCKCAVSGI